MKKSLVVFISTLLLICNVSANEANSYGENEMELYKIDNIIDIGEQGY